MQENAGRGQRSYDITAIKDFVRTANLLIDAGENEDRVRQHLISRIRGMFPDAPSWIDEHIRGGETALRFHRERGRTTGFVDNLVGLTAIEYEPDLRRQDRFVGGRDQVKEYCAGLLNNGAVQSQVVGVLSDTVRWYAYRVCAVNGVPPTLGKADIELEQIEEADCSLGDDLAANRLAAFLERYLRRLGSRPLDALSIATDLGFTSDLCLRYVEDLRAVTTAAEVGNPDYADLIQGLWQQFVAPVQHAAGIPFDSHEYVRELYILTLAKLVGANAVSQRARLDDGQTVKDILSGAHFRRLGLNNLVEYDYFGWITSNDVLANQLIPVAQAIQHDLQAYDFSRVAGEDLFGRLMTQLASRSQRILLGQEWTPPWLARKLVSATIAGLGDAAPRIIDPCCGSGSILVEALKAAKERHPRREGEAASGWAKRLTSFVTGFDIDPLAVLLAKISWLLSVRDDLETLGSEQLTIPIFHADSLFSTTPLGANPGLGGEDAMLNLDGAEVLLPACLFNATWRPVFDRVIDEASTVARVGATGEMAGAVIARLLDETNIQCGDEESAAVTNFVQQLGEALAHLHAQGRNGIWPFLIRNSYRPGLMAGDFNALVSNPPWLTLSKLGNNPYAEPLRELGRRYNLLATTQARHHLELASVFLVHAAHHYLSPGGKVTCILPETILDGEHLRPFRERRYAAPGSDVDLNIAELWEVPAGVFKNRAAVVVGTMGGAIPAWPLPGRVVGLGADAPDEATQFFVSNLGERAVWTRYPLGDLDGVQEAASFRQGADIMPRTLFFHDIGEVAGRPLVRLSKIRASSKLYFLVADAKRDADFELPQPCVLPSQLLAQVFISKMLVPFHVSPPAQALLPARRDESGAWTPLTTADVARLPGDFQRTEQAFCAMALRLAKGQQGRIPDFQAALNLLWSAIDTPRRKLSVQALLEEGQHLVFFGAGGELVCAASISINDFGDNLHKLVVDQTLYWTVVATASEADYLVAALNSPAVARIIAAFQPEGEFGRRHIHELPVRVIPPYDPGSASAIALRDAGRQLRRELDARLDADPDLRGRIFNLGGNLVHRRRLMRQLLSTLPSWPEYENAAENLMVRPE